jgi:hypothetical protein
MAQAAERTARKSAMQRPWPYLAAAAFSLVTVLVFFSLTLFLGVVVGMAGAFMGATSKRDEGIARGAHVFGLGLALLTGPAIYWLLVAVA